MRVIEEKINLKSSLADWRFHNDDEIKKAVITLFYRQQFSITKRYNVDYYISASAMAAIRKVDQAAISRKIV